MKTQRPKMTGLRAIRAARGLTQEDVARMVGCTKPFVAELELGRKGASVETLQRLATALGVTMEALFDDSVPAPRHAAP